MTTQESVSKANEWRHKLLICVSGLLVFETLTGLFIWLMPFSVSSQVMVLLHTILGLLFIVPYAWYQVRHWLVYRSTKLNHYKLTGYFSVIATVLAGMSGLVLSYQAVFPLDCQFMVLPIVDSRGITKENWFLDPEKTRLVFDEVRKIGTFLGEFVPRWAMTPVR